VIALLVRELHPLGCDSLTGTPAEREKMAGVQREDAGAVRVRLLGGLAVEIDGRPVPADAWNRRKGAALVGLLALSANRRLHREQVIDALWPDSPVTDAAPRLHKAAHHARRALGVPDSIVARSDTVALLPDAAVTVDAFEFADAAEAALTDGSVAAAASALTSYPGELLPELLYEPWTDEPRARLKLLHLQLLHQARRWDEIVERDPTDEEAHVEVMRSLYEVGARRAALLQFDRLDHILRNELGVEPGDAAVELRDRIVSESRAERATTERATSEHATTEHAVRAAVEPKRGEPQRLGDFPQPSDTFLGRDTDLATLAASSANSRIVTLFGPGGVGKTRLAVEFVRTVPIDSVFIDLSPVTDPSSVAAVFLQALGASTRTGMLDIDRVVETLEPRSVMLLIDNCEHQIEAVAEIAGRLARDTMGVRMLVTSREALGIRDETVVAVAPLPLPAEHATAEEQRGADAVRLFCARAERAGGTVDDLRAVVALVRRLDGIPLALELAAARTRTFAPDQILAQLDEGWPVAATRRATGPAHHNSLDETIDWSYRLLDEADRALLLQLSTFHGSFDLAAVTAVAEVVPMRAADLLARLVDKSLVQSRVGRAGRRLRLLDTVRRFAAARLDDAAAAVARDRHAAHFADQVTTLGAAIPGAGEDHALARLAVELDDVTAAFAQAIERSDIETAARLAVGPRLSVSAEGARWAQLALRAVDLPGIESDPAYVALVANAAWGAVLRGDLPRAHSLAQRGIEAAGDPAQFPRLCWIWPQALGESFAVGVQSCLDGASAARVAGDHAAESFLLATAAIYRLVTGDEAGAVAAADEALELAHAVGSRSLKARAAGALAYALQDLDADAARRAAAEVLDVAAPGDFHLNMPHRVLANLAWREGDSATAAEHALRAGELIRDQGDRYVQAAAMRQLAVMVGDVDAALAAELLGVADGIVPGIPVLARDAAAVARLQDRLEDELGADQLQALALKGRRTDARAAYAVASRGIMRLRDAVRTDIAPEAAR
jgi:predicted ATPase/DNA-binding SARP family transcriptional activator